MEKKYYTNERNAQILISLLKQYNIKKIIASPGSSNKGFVGSVQQDPWFEMYSCVDERSAAYLACGLSAETKEPVVLTCTGATASRNYLPGLTEAYYRKLPVLAVTSHRGDFSIGHLIDQTIDRRQRPNDIAVEGVTLPFVNSDDDEHYCMIEANKALAALTLNGGGPVHINLFTAYSTDFSVKVLPLAKKIKRYTIFDKLPELSEKGRIAIFVGSHNDFSEREINAIENFCSSNNAVVFCDHTSGYRGKYSINLELVCCQKHYKSINTDINLLIHIGEVTGCYHPNGKRVWRVSEDGAFRDPFRALDSVFMMPEFAFFEHYSRIGENNDQYLNSCKEEYEYAVSQLPELPFGNAWIAQKYISKLPKGTQLHLGIYNSLRSWNFFRLPENVFGKCNVGGFGIDGGVSTLIGASFANPTKLYFGVFGDLAFFYDMNVLGNRHVGKNIRLMIINNGRGTEFRLYGHPCAIFGDAADPYMAAAGHYGQQSPDLLRHFSKDLGFEYLSASSKEEFHVAAEKFYSSEIFDKPILLEVFTNSKDESDALEIIQNALTDKKMVLKEQCKDVVRKAVPSSILKAVHQFIH